MELADAQKFLHENHRACIAVRQKDGWPQMTFVTPGIDPEGRVILLVNTFCPALGSRLELAVKAFIWELLGQLHQHFFCLPFIFDFFPLCC